MPCFEKVSLDVTVLQLSHFFAFQKATGNNRDAKSKAQCEMPCPRKHKGNMTRFVFCLLLVHLKLGGGKQYLSWNMR